ncbi:hypothetical protein RJ639_039491 [Escallonia herrerae]|uniref:chalcone synthase n=1 Tax=Escallonia herrerae TaxID=1293975 RepID=A0AA88WNE8_9ASTE|nr:hypothetical protein RJ639_039491 [Escallonia herrerae]
MCVYMAPSLDARLDMVVVEILKLGKEATTKAIKERGQPKSKITHLVFCTTSSVDMPGADYQLTKLLGLRASVNRLMMYQQGCFADGTVLRWPRISPEQCADPDVSVERPLFQLVSAVQTILPDSKGAIDGHLREVGLTFHLLKDVPGLIVKNIEKSLKEAFAPIGIGDWNSLFWMAHPGGPTILDQLAKEIDNLVEGRLGNEDKRGKEARIDTNREDIGMEGGDAGGDER